MTNSAQRDTVKTLVKADTRTNGQTFINLGLEIANNIFAKNPATIPETDAKRNRMVVVFTDGVPGKASNKGGWADYNNDGDSGRCAEAALSQATTLKSTYSATVFSIGIFDGANANETDDDGNPLMQKWVDDTKTDTEAQAAPYANYFLHHLSSNFLADNTTKNKNQGYYKTAANAAALDTAFETIANVVEQGDSNSQPFSADETEVVDAVSNFFEMPKDSQMQYDTSGIKVYAVPQVGITKDDNHDPVFAAFDRNNQDITDDVSITVSADSDGNDTLSVSGFAFNDHWCGYVANKDANGTITSYTSREDGLKLIIEFPVKRDPDFIGGYDIPTNNEDKSGVYLSGEKKKSFNLPVVDVPFNGKAYAASKTVYYGSEVSPEALYFSNEGLTEKILTKLNKYVDFIKNNGTKSGDYYEIGSTQYEIDLPDLVSSSASGPVLSTTESDSHTVKIRMRKKGTDTWSGYNVSAKVYVLVPEVTFKDTHGFYGMPYKNADCLTNNVKETNWIPDGDWKEGQNGVPNRSGDPTYDLSKISADFVECTTTDAIVDGYTMKPYDVAVHVSNIKADGKSIKDFVQFSWASCDNHGENAAISKHAPSPDSTEFYLHSKSGADLPATGGSGTKNWFIVGLSLMTTPIMIGLSIKRKRSLINVF